MDVDFLCDPVDQLITLVKQAVRGRPKLGGLDFILQLNQGLDVLVQGLNLDVNLLADGMFEINQPG